MSWITIVVVRHASDARIARHVAAARPRRVVAIDEREVDATCGGSELASTAGSVTRESPMWIVALRSNRRGRDLGLRCRTHGPLGAVLRDPAQAPALRRSGLDRQRRLHLRDQALEREALTERHLPGVVRDDRQVEGGGLGDPDHATDLSGSMSFRGAMVSLQPGRE